MPVVRLAILVLILARVLVDRSGNKNVDDEIDSNEHQRDEDQISRHNRDIDKFDRLNEQKAHSWPLENSLGDDRKGNERANIDPAIVTTGIRLLRKA